VGVACIGCVCSFGFWLMSICDLLTPDIIEGFNIGLSPADLALACGTCGGGFCCEYVGSSN